MPSKAAEFWQLISPVVAGREWTLVRKQDQDLILNTTEKHLEVTALLLWVQKGMLISCWGETMS